MKHLDVAATLGVLALMLTTARVFSHLARKIGQPAVLGELVAGVVLGKSALGLVQTDNPAIQLLAETGVVLLLFSIGIETDLKKLLRVGPASLVTALAGVILPFALGFAAGKASGLKDISAIVVGASLTATSVGITSRVLSELGWLQRREGQVVLGAAILDDVIGLVILTVVSGFQGGKPVSMVGIATTTAIAFGFLAATVVIGGQIVPRTAILFERIKLPGTSTILAVSLAFGLAWLADRSGSALIIGAFTAGLLIVKLPVAQEIERGVTSLGHFFVPLFFVSVGAAVDVKSLNPFAPSGGRTLIFAMILTLLAILGKFAAGYAPFWLKGRKDIIGAAMIPRGEVGLIFAEKGLAAGALDPALFSAVTLVVMITTFVAPPLLKRLAPKPDADFSPDIAEGIDDLTNV